jgi:phosphomannomutase
MDLFGTAGIRGDVRTRVTPELALSVGRAVGTDAVEGNGSGELVVARDGRTTGGALAAAVEAGARSAGADVRRAGQLPTPALAFASLGRHGVQVTASHNPPEDNGLKCFADGEEYHTDDERRVADRVETGTDPVDWDRWGGRQRRDVLGAYRETVVDYAREHGPDPGGVELVVDCGNGMAAPATPAVLRALGAAVRTLNGNVDGHFPGRPSKPTADTLGDLRAFLRERDSGAVGIAHDGDADRIVLVDPDGEVVHEDTVLAILAEQYVRASDATDPVVVTTPNASGRIDERVEAAGGRVERVRLGALHEGVRSARAAGGDVVFAGEPWKHLHPGLGPWIDGVASAAVLAVLIGAADGGDGEGATAGLASLRAPVTERPYRKLSVSCPDDAKADVMATLERTLPAAFQGAGVDTEHGVRVALDDGAWALVRPSGTEPYVRIYAESDDVDALVERVRTRVEAAVAETAG